MQERVGPTLGEGYEPEALLRVEPLHGCDHAGAIDRGGVGYGASGRSGGRLASHGSGRETHVGGRIVPAFTSAPAAPAIGIARPVHFFPSSIITAWRSPALNSFS